MRSPLHHASPWLARFALLGAAFILIMIARKFITDPIGAAAALQIHLDSPLAVTNARAGFGAFPLGCALVALGSLWSRRFHLVGLTTVATVIGSVLIVRIGGIVVDRTFAASRTVLGAETALLLITLLAIGVELSRRRADEATAGTQH